MSSQAHFTQATNDELARAVEENLFALFRAMRALPGCEVVDAPGLSYHHAPPNNPMFKGVWRTRLAPEATDAAIAEVTAWFKARKVPYVFWWTGPGDQPADLQRRLIERGFMLNMPGDPGMAVELDALAGRGAGPEGFSVEQVNARQGLEDWRDVFVAAYGVPQFTGQAWVDATLALGPEAAPWRLYVGYLNGRPVATSALFIGAGVAGMYGVGTLPEARRKGLGAAITARPLLDAQAQGLRYGVLFSTNMGHPIYRRLGFRDVPCKIGRLIRWNE